MYCLAQPPTAEWPHRLEELAEAEFRHADARKLKVALIDAIAYRFAEDPADEGGGRFGSDEDAARAELAAELGRLGFADLLARIERTITTPRSGGHARRRRPPTFCTRGSSFSPCIDNGIP